jgi:hypothetical protein
LETWLLAATWLSLAGWGLSLLGTLNTAGYVVATLLGLAGLIVWGRWRMGGRPIAWRRPVRGWRWRKPLPLVFLAVFGLAGLGGLLYAPTNFDALTYRVPPVLHWLDAGRWHWITTSNDLYNLNSPGFAWGMAALLALTKSDRGFFLLNLAALAAMPGSFFIVLRLCGVARRVAWCWMWLLPTGYCFALQAGGIGNDLLPAAYLLASVALALRARGTGRVADLWLSALAIALCTGVKIIAAPLALVWLAAAAPSRALLARYWIGTVAIATLAAIVSFLPTAILNHLHTGSWSGDPANFHRISLQNPLAGLAGNAVQLGVGNAAPPIWPAPGLVNRALDSFLENPWGRALRHHYPRLDPAWYELATEEGASLGLGLGVLAALIPLAALAGGGWRRPGGRDAGFWISLAAMMAFLVFCAKTGSEAAPRLAAPYYPMLLIPLLRRPVNERLTRRRWWRSLAVIAAASILPALILTPARPLWPARSILAALVSAHPGSSFLARTREVFEVYAQRHDYLAPLKKHFPPGVRTIGYVPTGNDLTVSLWRPFGERRVLEVLQPSRADAAVRELRGSIIVASGRALQDHFGLSVEAFSAAVGARVSGHERFAIKVSVGIEDWYVFAVE